MIKLKPQYLYMEFLYVCYKIRRNYILVLLIPYQNTVSCYIPYIPYVIQNVVLIIYVHYIVLCNQYIHISLLYVQIKWTTVLAQYPKPRKQFERLSNIYLCKWLPTFLYYCIPCKAQFSGIIHIDWSECYYQVNLKFD